VRHFVTPLLACQCGTNTNFCCLIATSVAISGGIRINQVMFAHHRQPLSPTKAPAPPSGVSPGSTPPWLASRACLPPSALKSSGLPKPSVMAWTWCRTLHASGPALRPRRCSAPPRPRRDEHGVDQDVLQIRQMRAPTVQLVPDAAAAPTGKLLRTRSSTCRTRQAATATAPPNAEPTRPPPGRTGRRLSMPYSHACDPPVIRWIAFHSSSLKS